MLLWLAERGREPGSLHHRGDCIEAVAIGRGRLDLRGGLLKVAASLLVVSTTISMPACAQAGTSAMTTA